jgi:hypothetical protein
MPTTTSVKNFIGDLARAMKDPTMVVNTATDWLEILNANGSELSPEVMFEYQVTVPFTPTVDVHKNEIDMSSETLYPGLHRVKAVFFLDTENKQFEYANWTFDRNNRILYLMPINNDDYVDNVTYAPRPGGYYPNIAITWLGELPDTNGDGTITMTKPRLTLFRKICVREGIRRILLDQTKFDRYRTLVNRANSYELIAIIRDMTAEIELDKARLVNSNSVRVF